MEGSPFRSVPFSGLRDFREYAEKAFKKLGTLRGQRRSLVSYIDQLGRPDRDSTPAPGCKSCHRFLGI